MKKPLAPILLRGLTHGAASYPAVLSAHTTLANALRWGRISGLSNAPSLGRDGRLWIEERGRPAWLRPEHGK